MRTQLHFFPTFALGGSQRRFAQIARGVPGWRHVIVALDGDRAADAALGEAERSYEALTLAKSSGLSPANLRLIGKLLSRVKPDLACTYNWGSMEVVIANRLRRLTGRGVPHLHFEDGFGPEESDGQLPRRRQIRRLALPGVHVAVPSSGLEVTAREDWRVPEGRLHRIDNGVDLSRFSPGTPPTEPLVVYLGALRPEKNVGRLIEAARRTGVRVDLWGAGGEEAALRALGAETVRFKGPTDAPEAALRGASVFALSSDTEQMPLTVLEAMACGLPVVATDVGDTKLLVAPENTRFVTPLGDDDAYAAALRILATNDALAREVGAANRRKVEAEYGLDRMLDAYEALFDRVAA